jgi:hypothetical protein
LPAEAAEAVSAFWTAWSRGEGMAQAWPAFWAQWVVLARHAESWAAAMRSNGDLATKLVQFCSNRI